MVDPGGRNTVKIESNAVATVVAGQDRVERCGAERERRAPQNSVKGRGRRRRLGLGAMPAEQEEEEKEVEASGRGSMGRRDRSIMQGFALSDVDGIWLRKGLVQSETVERRQRSRLLGSRAIFADSRVHGLTASS